jgi:predicted secreted hydrolase
MLPNDDAQGWDSRQVWMGHAAVTSADTHRFAETLSRGGIATAGVAASPLEAFIDDWRLGAEQGFDAQRVGPIAMTASAKDFSVALKLDSDRPLVLQGESGFSRKSEAGQASYYYSQPFYRAAGTLTLDSREIAVSGHAWLDREWSSQPLAADQSGWDWLSLHLDGGEKLMLFRLRGRGSTFHSGNWIAADGSTTQLAADAIAMIPAATTRVANRDVPTAWRIAIAAHGFEVTTAPLNPQCWMATRFPYWEGPIAFAGSHRGVGYLEMTGY